MKGCLREPAGQDTVLRRVEQGRSTEGKERAAHADRPSSSPPAFILLETKPLLKGTRGFFLSAAELMPEVGREYGRPGGAARRPLLSPLPIHGAFLNLLGGGALYGSVRQEKPDYATE